MLNIINHIPRHSKPTPTQDRSPEPLYWNDFECNQQLTTEENKTLLIETGFYPAVLTREYITIGCEIHTPQEWAAFSTEELGLMSPIDSLIRYLYGQRILATHKTAFPEQYQEENK